MPLYTPKEAYHAIQSYRYTLRGFVFFPTYTYAQILDVKVGKKAVGMWLDPEVSIASNGYEYSHPTSTVALRLFNEVGSQFFQTNKNTDSRAHQPDPKFVEDDTYHEDDEKEEFEGATGNITVVVDPESDKYYLVMDGLSLGEGSFGVEE